MVGLGVGVVVLILSVDFFVKDLYVVGMFMEYFFLVILNVNDGFVRFLLNENVFGLLKKVVKVM